jgi:hypothetical protein
MKKSTLLSMMLIIGLSISSFSQTKEVLSQDKINTKTINKSIADSQKISQSLQIKPFKFNPISLDGPQIIVVDGKLSEKGYKDINPRDILSLSVLKGERATSLYGNKDASSVIIITTKRASNETKAENEQNKK